MQGQDWLGSVEGKVHKGAMPISLSAALLVRTVDDLTALSDAGAPPRLFNFPSSPHETLMQF